MAAMSKKSKRRQNAADILYRRMSSRQKVRHVVNAHAGLTDAERAQVLRDLERGGGQGTVGQQAAQAAASGAQGGAGDEPPNLSPEARRQLATQHAADRAAERGIRWPVGIPDSARMLTEQQIKKQREQEAERRKRKPSKKERDAERRYQERRRAAGLPPSGVGGTPVMPGSGGSFVG